MVSVHSFLLLASTQTPISPEGLPGANVSNTGNSEIQSLLGVLFGIVGAIAVLIILISGFRYITSTGDPQKAAQAKNGIIYALIGLAVAISAEALVAFVVGRL